MDKVVVIKSCFIFWTPPSHDWVKLNVDGSLIPYLGSISAGSVIRDNKKNWLVEFDVNNGLGSVIETVELLSIFEGLKLAWKAGFRKVTMKSDSQSDVLLLNNNTLLNHPLFNIIHAYKSLRKSPTDTLKLCLQEILEYWLLPPYFKMLFPRIFFYSFYT
ncbi:hypothetical protein Dsin_025027 [Dipteronia sinensis]|uniref:RNase H type-1 domain-containing protein n=1 Tax=Dipteronia sinensis TaxID=43782 RepID=A0AAD9ZV30_9ROSI|nr:hypothetical protein Dsin_025027 [Dipteronia sinensis]